MGERDIQSIVDAYDPLFELVIQENEKAFLNKLKPIPNNQFNGGIQISDLLNLNPIGNDHDKAIGTVHKRFTKFEKDELKLKPEEIEIVNRILTDLVFPKVQGENIHDADYGLTITNVRQLILSDEISYLDKFNDDGFPLKVIEILFISNRRIQSL